MLSTTQKKILWLLQKYGVADRKILQEECGITDDARAREIIRGMVARGWIDRVQVRSECLIAPKPVFFPNEAGCALLASQSGDMADLLQCRPPKSGYTYFAHYLGVTRALLLIVKAFGAQVKVKLVRFLTEHHFVRPGVMMLTEVGVGQRGGRVIANPDFAIVIEIDGELFVIFGEYETGSDGSPTRVAAKKAPGYAAFFAQEKYRDLFPGVTEARVLAITPYAGFREAMRRALKERNAKNWLLVTRDDLGGDFLHTPVFHSPTSEEPTLLVKSPPPPPVTQVAAGGVTGDETVIVSH